jgi:hypothetical protein
MGFKGVSFAEYSSFPLPSKNGHVIDSEEGF